MMREALYFLSVICPDQVLFCVQDLFRALSLCELKVEKFLHLSRICSQLILTAFLFVFFCKLVQNVFTQSQEVAVRPLIDPTKE